MVYFSYEATSSRRSRSLAKEIATAAVASVFLVSAYRYLVVLQLLSAIESVMSKLALIVLQGFGSLFVLLASGVYV